MDSVGRDDRRRVGTARELSPASASAEVRDAVMHAIAELSMPAACASQRRSIGQWITHAWLKKAVLLSFRLAREPGDPVAPASSQADAPQFYDKVPTKFGGLHRRRFRGRAASAWCRRRQRARRVHREERGADAVLT